MNTRSENDFIAIHFGSLVRRLAGNDDPVIEKLGAYLVQQTLDGHSAVPLREASAVVELAPDRLRGLLTDSGVCGAPEAFTPLILDDDERLYLHRYWRYERNVADALLLRADAGGDLECDAEVGRLLAELFPLPEENDQKAAAAVAALRTLAVISGGPGTGKTTTVVRLLALLHRLQPTWRMALAAPTGKAAARVSQAITGAREALPWPGVAAQLPSEAATLHRLLGYRPGGVCRYHRGNPLPYDVVVVDEASMIGVALMARLLDAMAPTCKLVLLGDRDQLDSVEPGSVLGDICADSDGFTATFAKRLDAMNVCVETTPPRSRLQDCVVTLRHSYRFDADSEIGLFARAVRDGDAAAALALLRDATNIDLQPLTDPVQRRQWLQQRVVTGLQPYFAAVEDGVADRTSLFDAFRLLCVFRRGSTGVAGLNRLAERALTEAGLIVSGVDWYPGKPVMINRNDYTAALFNGDIGYTVIADERPAVEFESRTGWRRLATPRLPEHETVYAMTVHKTQGSEFDDVVLVLPDQPSPILGREIVYTAVTRARRRVEIVGHPELLAEAISRSTQRSSGLRAALAIQRPASAPVQGELEL